MDGHAQTVAGVCLLSASYGNCITIETYPTKVSSSSSPPSPSPPKQNPLRQYCVDRYSLKVR